MTQRAMPKEHSLIDIMAIARKRLVWVAVPIVALCALAWLYTDRQTPVYEATARVLLSEDAPTRALDPGSQNPGIVQREIENQMALAYSPAVEAALTAELGFLPELAVSHNPDSDILMFVAEGATAEEAANSANTWAEIFVLVRQERDLSSIAVAMLGLQSRLDALEAEQEEIRQPLDTLRRQIRAATDPVDAQRLQQDYDLMAEELRFELELKSSEAQTTVADLARLRLQSELAAAEQNRIAEPAEVPDDPMNTPLSRILVIAIIVGVAMGLGLAVLMDARDKSLRTPADLQGVTDLPVLATVPKAKRSQRPSIGLATIEDPKGAQADAYHQVRSALEFEMHLSPIRSIMVTSPVPGDGRSTVAANLALALGSIGTRTALVDSDYRAGSLHRIFGIERQPGLSDLVRREIKASRVARSLPGDESEDLVVLPSGTVPPNPAAFVASPRFLSTLRWMGTQADIVVVDAPPLLGIPETHTIGRHVDGVILVLRSKQTTEDELREALAVLEQVNTRVIGIVMVGVPRTRKSIRQHAIARRQAAQDLPPVLNVDEGPRTADFSPVDAVGVEVGAGVGAGAGVTAEELVDLAHQEHGAVANLEAGWEPVVADDVTDIDIEDTGEAEEIADADETTDEDQTTDAEYTADADEIADVDEVIDDEAAPIFDDPPVPDPAPAGLVVLAETEGHDDSESGSQNGDEDSIEASHDDSQNGDQNGDEDGSEAVPVMQDGDGSSDMTAAPGNRAGESDEDWFQSRAPIDSNGNGTNGSETNGIVTNGNETNGRGHSVDAAVDIVAETDEELYDETIDGLAGDIVDDMVDEEAYVIVPSKSNGEFVTEFHEEFDGEIVDLAELDDDLVE